MGEPMVTRGGKRERERDEVVGRCCFLKVIEYYEALADNFPNFCFLIKGWPTEKIIILLTDNLLLLLFNYKMWSLPVDDAEGNWITGAFSKVSPQFYKQWLFSEYFNT